MLDRKPEIPQLAPLTNDITDSECPAHPLPPTQQVCNRHFKHRLTSSPLPECAARWFRPSALPHHQGYLLDGCKTPDSRVAFPRQKEPSLELGSLVTPEVALTPLLGQMWVTLTQRGGWAGETAAPCTNEASYPHPDSPLQSTSQHQALCLSAARLSLSAIQIAPNYQKSIIKNHSDVYKQANGVSENKVHFLMGVLCCPL